MKKRAGGSKKPLPEKSKNTTKLYEEEIKEFKGFINFKNHCRKSIKDDVIYNYELELFDVRQEYKFLCGKIKELKPAEHRDQIKSLTLAADGLVGKFTKITNAVQEYKKSKGFNKLSTAQV